MVKADICNEQMKKLRDQRKKELKKPSIQEQAPSKNKPEKKEKKKPDVTGRQRVHFLQNLHNFVSYTSFRRNIMKLYEGKVNL
jgi:hypothetical protein